MSGLDSLLAFSHHYCVAICTLLVPANLTATLASLIMAGQGASQRWLNISTVVATLLAVTLLLHVLSWFLIGVVMPPTYILLTLASVCLSFNAWALTRPRWLAKLWYWCQQQWEQRWAM
jgi:hypothetical protein